LISRTLISPCAAGVRLLASAAFFFFFFAEPSDGFGVSFGLMRLACCWPTGRRAWVVAAWARQWTPGRRELGPAGGYGLSGAAVTGRRIA